MKQVVLRRSGNWSLTLGVILSLLGPGPQPALLGQGADGFLLPDLIVRRADLSDNLITIGEIEPGRIRFKFSTGIANVGEGKLYLHGAPLPNPDGTQDILQRLFRSDGSFEDHDAGSFVFHRSHDHIHVEEFAIYRLREVLPGNRLGPVILESEKISFCVLDLLVHDRTLRRFNRNAEFRQCTAGVQGLSVGWLDIYDKSLPGQSFDITGVPEGVYWLEAEVDPEDHILELDETNNTSRIQIVIGNLQGSSPDSYEPNDSPAEVDTWPVGAPGSPNLGPCNPKKILENLSIHATANDDYFKFYVNETATVDDFVRIEFNQGLGNLDLAVLDAEGKELRASRSSTDDESVLLRGLPEGWYYVRVWGRGISINASYRLIINPPENRAPSITILTPPIGDTKRIHGSDSYRVAWEVTDPEDDLTWVSVFLNRNPWLDGEEVPAATARFVPGDLGAAILNSAEFEEGTYWIHCQVTDGGVTKGAWSDGTVTFFEFGDKCLASGFDPDCNLNGILDECELTLDRQDCNANGMLDDCDLAFGRSRDTNGNRFPDECEIEFHRGDPNDDGDVDISDAIAVLLFLFIGAERPACTEAGDADNDGFLVITDGIYLLNFLFLGGPPPADPGPPSHPCGRDSTTDDTSEFLGCDRYTQCP